MENYNRSQIDPDLSEMIKIGLKESPEMNDYKKNLNKFLDDLAAEYKAKIVFFVDDSEILWDEFKIKVKYRREDDEGEIDTTVKKICISDFCFWIKKNKKNVFLYDGFNAQGIWDEWTKTYNPIDVIELPIFDLNYHLELFLSDRGY